MFAFIRGFFNGFKCFCAAQLFIERRGSSLCSTGEQEAALILFVADGIRGIKTGSKGGKSSASCFALFRQQYLINDVDDAV